MKFIQPTQTEKEQLAQLEMDARGVLTSLGYKVPYVKLGVHNSKRTYGQAHYIQGVYDSITISRQYLMACYKTDYRNVVSVMIHEFIHTMCPTYVHHSGMWKRIANDVTRQTDYVIQTYATQEQAMNFKEDAKAIGIDTTRHRMANKYKVVCNGCGSSFYYKKETKMITRLKNGYEYARCPYCKGHTFTVYDL